MDIRIFKILPIEKFKDNVCNFSTDDKQIQENNPSHKLMII